jgi:hypothetical protein
MRLLELFPDSADQDGQQDVPSEGVMTQKIRQAALDVITPYLGSNVPFVTMQVLIDRLSSARFGIVITPALIQQILDPNQVKAIDRIEGNRIYLEQPNKDMPARAVDQDQKEKDRAKVGDMATKQAAKAVQQ